MPTTIWPVAAACSERAKTPPSEQRMSAPPALTCRLYTLPPGKMIPFWATTVLGATGSENQTASPSAHTIRPAHETDTPTGRSMAVVFAALMESTFWAVSSVPPVLNPHRVLKYGELTMTSSPSTETQNPAR